MSPTATSGPGSADHRDTTRRWRCDAQRARAGLPPAGASDWRWTAGNS